MNRFQFVADHQDTFEVKRLCELVEIGRSSFYAWLKGIPARQQRAVDDAQLAERIRAVHDTDNTCGAPRITAELARIPEVLQVHGLSGSIDLLARVACRDARHLFDTDARILSIEGVERTETSLAMGEVIPYRVAGLIGLARREP